MGGLAFPALGAENAVGPQSAVAEAASAPWLIKSRREMLHWDNTDPFFMAVQSLEAKSNWQASFALPLLIPVFQDTEYLAESVADLGVVADVHYEPAIPVSS